MLKIVNKKKFFLFFGVIIFILISICFGIFIAWKKFSQETMLGASIGEEKKIYQLLIKTKNSDDNLNSNSSSDAKRGDVLLSADESRQWSDTEKEIFLIIKVRLTKKQNELIFLSKKNEDDFDDTYDRKDKKEIKKVENKKRYVVDLNKIGIADDDYNGRFIEDKVFDWEDILIKK